MWRGGVDPVSYIRSFQGRVRLLHLKDYRIGLVSDPTHMPSDIFGPLEEFAEVGEGCLDMPAIIQAGLVNILRWQSHPISRNRATGSVIESRSSDGGSHDLCRGSQYGDLAFDRSFPLPHGYFPVNPHGIGRWYDAVKDRIGKGTASQSFMPAFRHEL